MTGRKSIMVDTPIWNKIDRYRHDIYVRSIGDAIENAVDIASSEERYVCVHRTQVTKSPFLTQEKADTILKCNYLSATYIIGIDPDLKQGSDHLSEDEKNQLFEEYQKCMEIIDGDDNTPLEDIPFSDCVIAVGRTANEVIQKVGKTNPDVAMEIKLYDEVDTRDEEEYFVVKCSPELYSEACYLDYYNKYNIPLTCDIPRILIIGGSSGLGCTIGDDSDPKEFIADIKYKKFRNIHESGCYAIITSLDMVRLVGPSLGRLLKMWSESRYEKDNKRILIAKCSNRLLHEHFSRVGDRDDPVYYICRDREGILWDSFDEENMCIDTTPEGEYYAGVVYWDDGRRAVYSIGKTANNAMKNGKYVYDGKAEDWYHYNGKYIAGIDYRYQLDSYDDDEESSVDEEEVDESYKLVVMECSKELYEKARKEFGCDERFRGVTLPCKVIEREGKGRFADVCEETSSGKSEA